MLTFCNSYILWLLCCVQLRLVAVTFSDVYVMWCYVLWQYPFFPLPGCGPGGKDPLGPLPPSHDAALPVRQRSGDHNRPRYSWHERVTEFCVPVRMASKCTKHAENVYAPLVMMSTGAWKRTLAGKRAHHNESTDTNFDPPLFSLDSTFLIILFYFWGWFGGWIAGVSRKGEDRSLQRTQRLWNLPGQFFFTYEYILFDRYTLMKILRRCCYITVDSACLHHETVLAQKGGVQNKCAK